MSYFQQTCQYFDKDVKKMTLFIAEIAQNLTVKSEKIHLLLGNSSQPFFDTILSNSDENVIDVSSRNFEFHCFQGQNQPLKILRKIERCHKNDIFVKINATLSYFDPKGVNFMTPMSKKKQCGQDYDKDVMIAGFPLLFAAQTRQLYQARAVGGKVNISLRS